MARYFRFFEIAYLIISIVFFWETYVNWQIDRQRAYLFLAFAVLAVFMFFFRRKYRKRYESYNRKDRS